MGNLFWLTDAQMARLEIFFMTAGQGSDYTEAAALMPSLP
jgi:hypothetical protein